MASFLKLNEREINGRKLSAVFVRLSYLVEVCFFRLKNLKFVCLSYKFITKFAGYLIEDNAKIVMIEKIKEENGNEKNMISYYLLAVAVAVLCAVGLVVVKKGTRLTENQKSWIFKGASLVLAFAFGLRYLSGEIALIKTVGLNLHSPFGRDGRFATACSVLLLWLTFATLTLLTTYPFFKNTIKILTPLVKFFATPVYVVDFIVINTLIVAMGGVSALENGFARQGAFFAIEIGLSLAICFFVWLEEYKTNYEKLFPKFLFVALGMVAASTPVFALQALFGRGPATILLKDLTFAHRVLLYGSFLLPALIIWALYKQDYEHKRYALLYLSLATMISYSFKYDFSSFADLSAWPLHLCNTAMFILPLCLIFKLDKLFYFTLFINVLGAFLAMAMPNTDSQTSVFSARSLEFWTNHYIAFFMPFTCVGLKLYARPKMKLFIYSLVAFAIYYAVVLFLNAYLTAEGKIVDFFFINSDFVADKLGRWALDLRLVVAEIPLKNGRVMTFYPLYQSLYFLVYVGLSFAMWFLYELAFAVEDLYVDIYVRNKKMKGEAFALKRALNGREISEPLNMDGRNKLVLRNFTKKYATSDVYAVYDANLEIEGGQIFGFLGPNGAGKSTIIKSIVGIQPITAGSIEVCGYDVDKQPVGAKLQTGFVPDHYALYENLTGREYVNYIADLYNVSKEDRDKRIEEFVERFCLQGSFDNPMKTYSHGMKQKITIMSALVHNPKLWILDEPLTGLDPESIFQVKEAMKAHARAGNIVFFSSHIIDVVERICDRIAIIKKGRILCERGLKELESEGVQLESFYMNMIGNPPSDKTKGEVDLKANDSEN